MTAADKGAQVPREGEISAMPTPTCSAGPLPLVLCSTCSPLSLPPSTSLQGFAQGSNLDSYSSNHKISYTAQWAISDGGMTHRQNWKSTSTLSQEQHDWYSSGLCIPSSLAVRCVWFPLPCGNRNTLQLPGVRSFATKSAPFLYSTLALQMSALFYIMYALFLDLHGYYIPLALFYIFISAAHMVLVESL